MKKNKYWRLVKNTLLLLTGNFVTKILSFLMVPFYTSILSTSDYGTADLISTTVLLALPFFGVLMDEAVMRFTLEKTTDKRQVFTIAMVISSIGFVIAMCISPVILLFNSLKQYYWFIVLYYIASWLFNISMNYVKGLDRLEITTTAGVIHTFFFLGLNIYFLSVARIGVYGYLLAIDLSNIIAVAYLVVRCKLYRCFVGIRFLDIGVAKKMVTYSIPMIPDYISWWINNASDRFILTFFCGASVNGVYSVAYKIPTILNSLTSIFSSAWKISSVDDFGSEESIKFYNRVFEFYCGLLFVSASILVVITKPLARLIFASEFFIAWRITPLLVFAYIYSALAIFVGSIFTASRKTQKLFIAPLIGAFVNTMSNIILIPKLQGTGAAIATIMGYATILIVQIINTRTIIRVDFKLPLLISSSVCIAFEIVMVLQEKLICLLIALGIVIIIAGINGKAFKQIVEIAWAKIIRKRHEE